ncbi:CopD family protein [uncultured Roseovarius sp.]|uniref:CopD family protein n=1 Tax=uncultured Roseovarius sp. TaxID=293344 RepID=UPI0026330322|nr:CopD family protein [uncultured Roseovarius sp.]
MPDIWALAAVVSKTLLYFGVLTSGGLILVRFVFASEVAAVLPVMRKYAVLCAILGLAAAGISFALRGAALTGDASGLTDPDMLGLMWQTSVGTALLLRVIGLSLVLAGLLVGGLGWGLAGLGVLTALWSFITIGHLSDDIGLWARLVLLTHLLAVAFWIGVLLPLNRLTITTGDTVLAARLGHRFGQIATVVIPSLIAAGVVLGWLLVGSWTHLFTTAYGLNIIAKLCLVAGLLGLGVLNKLRIVPELISGNAQAAVYLSKTVSMEWLVFVAVLLATAALTTLFALPGKL